MSPRPAKGTLPKGPQPVISFRVPQSALDLISEIRSLEPFAEPGLVPLAVGSNSDFARWLFLDAAKKLRERLKLELQVKDQLIKEKNLNDRLELVTQLHRSGKLDKEAYLAESRALEDAISENHLEIAKTCELFLVGLPQVFFERSYRGGT